MLQEQKEALKDVYQFVHDLADQASPAYYDLGGIRESAQDVKWCMEQNFATDMWDDRGE